jgi:hypothetical protein
MHGKENLASVADYWTLASVADKYYSTTNKRHALLVFS